MYVREVICSTEKSEKWVHDCIKKDEIHELDE